MQLSMSQIIKTSIQFNNLKIIYDDLKLLLNGKQTNNTKDITK